MPLLSTQWKTKPEQRGRKHFERTTYHLCFETGQDKRLRTSIEAEYVRLCIVDILCRLVVLGFEIDSTSSRQRRNLVVSQYGTQSSTALS